MKRNSLLKECIAELVGTFVILLFGVGSVAALVLKQNYDSFWELSVMWGIAVTLGIYISGGVTGAHLNPAVTIALTAFKGFPAKKIGPYIVFQTLGAFLGAAMAYLLFIQNFVTWEMENNIIRGSAESQALASIFTTYPQAGLNHFAACGVEVVITALFMMVILGVTDDKNPAAPGSGLAAVMIGAVVALIGGTFGSLTGFALNPARDFGPRIFAALSGWGEMAFPGPNAYFWVPIVGPILGALIGGFLYQKLIHNTLVDMKS